MYIDKNVKKCRRREEKLSTKFEKMGNVFRKHTLCRSWDWWTNRAPMMPLTARIRTSENKGVEKGYRANDFVLLYRVDYVNNRFYY